MTRDPKLPRRKPRKPACIVAPAIGRAACADSDDLPGVIAGMRGPAPTVALTEDQCRAALEEGRAVGAELGRRVKRMRPPEPVTLEGPRPITAEQRTLAGEPARLVLSERGCELYEASWRALAEVARAAGGVDALIVDAPYSERTHAGHDGADRNDGSGVIVARHDHAYGHREKTRGIDYVAWSADDVRAFVNTWSPLARGWLVTITDDVLAPVWRAALEAAGRYAFAPLPLVCVGSTVRLVGDGPCSWTCWIVVSRPKSGEWLGRWRAQRRAAGLKCALPGAYHYTGHGDRAVMGGKTTASIRDLVKDYSAPGDLVCDPCAGGGTLGVACIAEGRRALLGDSDASHVAIAAERLRSLPAAEKRGTLALPWAVGS